MLLTFSSPHLKNRLTTQHVMGIVILMTVPGLIAQTYLFGWGNLINVLWCSIVAMTTEALVLKARGESVKPYLSDLSALLTGVLLGLALPPFAPWWLSLVATSFAIVFSKQLYGGMGYNPFNPAMIGYALVLVSFPVAMTTNWAIPTESVSQSFSLLETFSVIFGGTNSLDGYTGATPLDVYKQQTAYLDANSDANIVELGGPSSNAWMMINLAFLIGGLGLIRLKIIQWQTPLGVLLGIAMPALFVGLHSGSLTPLSVHMSSGASMLGAFFIATDPVTSSTTKLGRFIFGLGVGLLTFIIRAYGSYPDAIAFAVLLMNFAAPLIDAYTQPRAYGYLKAKRGPKASE